MSATPFVELFAGIGGLGEGLKTVGGECVFANEYDKYAAMTYEANNPGVPVDTRDVRQVEVGAIPEHDVLLAGFPCQPFSVAGISKRRALGVATGMDCEDQGNLFFEVVRVIASKRPRAVVLENVKNFARHDNGRTFEIIADTLDCLGYGVTSRIIDAAAWLPQHRERIFIVALSDHDTCDLESIHLPPEPERPRMNSILHSADGSEAPEPPYTKSTQPLRVSDKYVLTDRIWTYLQEYRRKHEARGNGFGFGLVGPDDRARTLSARYYKDGSEILVRRRRGNPRRLTPRECSRLMGFDKPRGSDFVIPVSDTQAYKQFGNAVAVPAAEAVAGVVAKCL